MLISHLFNVVLYMFKHFFRLIRLQNRSVLSLVAILAHRRPRPLLAATHEVCAFTNLVLVLGAQLVHAAFAVELLPDLLVGRHESVNLSCELIVLVRDNTDVIVHGVDFHLQVGVGLNQRGVRVLRTLQLALQIHNLVFFRSNLDLQVLELSNELRVLVLLSLSSLMQIAVLLFVLLLELL